MAENKPVMIDRVDVSECIFYQANFEEDFDVKINHFCSNWHNSCESVNNSSCYYKQFKRKEQECEELKRLIAKQSNAKIQLSKLKDKQYKEFCDMKQTLAEIKEMLKEICMEECSFDWNKTSKKHCGDCDCRYGQILQKISECEVKDDNK